MAVRRSKGGTSSSGEVDAHVQLAKATWPQIDPEVEGIVVRIARAAELLDRATRASIHRVGLTKEELKVICTLHSGARTHGSLCSQLGVSTGSMTNRLDKLERAGLIERSPDPADRRGVLLDLTVAGEAKLDAYIELGASRERKLLAGVGTADKRRLNELLDELLDSLHADIDRRTPDTVSGRGG